MVDDEITLLFDQYLPTKHEKYRDDVQVATCSQMIQLHQTLQLFLQKFPLN